MILTGQHHAMDFLKLVYSTCFAKVHDQWSSEQVTHQRSDLFRRHGVNKSLRHREGVEVGEGE